VCSAGTRFNILTGALVRFERELARFFLDFHTKRRGSDGRGSGGYSEVSVPYIVSHDTLQCTGHLPKFRDDLFGISHKVMGQSAFLIPTAEVPITSMFMHQVLDSRDLPLKFVAHTPCFRAEAGK
jgi:seryl-tRNA synthetase